MNVTNIVRAVVKPGIDYTVTSPIMKENKGQILLIEGLDLPEIYEIDFSNDRHHGTSVTMIGNADGVLIPTQFIKTGRDVYAFYYYVGDNFGQTEHIFRLPNSYRPDRTDEEPEPEQQSTIDQAIAAVNEAVVKTEENKTAAKNSAGSAKDDADRAERARDAAEGHSRDAGNAANRADTSERNAKGYSEDAGRSANQAATSERNAANSAAEAGRKADEITGLTVEAETLTPGSEATADYQNGQLILGIPRGDKGEKGDTGATGPRGVQGIQGPKGDKGDTGPKGDKGDQGVQGIQGPKGDKGDIGPQGVKGDTGEQGIQGEQGERGLTGATGATGATPNLSIGTVDTLEPTESATATITGTPENPVLNLGIPQGEQGEVTTEEFLKAFVTDSASGSIASFPDGANGIPLKSLVVNIDPVQDLSQGDPSPENICPISGWTEVDVEQRGVNVWDEEWELANINWSTSVFTPATNGGRLASKNYIPVVEGNYYCNYTRAQTFLAGYTDDNGNGGRGLTVDYNTNIVTIPSDVHFIKFAIVTSYYGTTYNHDISINYPSTDHDYHPYTGRSITINLGQTVYGGHLDVLSGVLTVDRANIASYNGETLPSTWISDRDIYASGTTPTTGAQVVYQLATPLTIQLTPNQVNSLLGVNNIWADSGDSEVIYRADTKLYIQKKIAEAIASLS